MILPGNHTLLLFLLALGMVCWGAWANTFKASAGIWRFELYYFDFAIGLLLAATLTALTFGNLGFDGFSFIDDVRLAGRRQEVFAVAAGAVFNLGNMLLLAGVSVAGMAVAFPVGGGFSLLVASGWVFALSGARNTGLLLGGLAAILAAVVVDIQAFHAWSKAKAAVPVAAAEAAGNKPKRKKARKAGILKGVVLSLAGGLLLGSFAPVVHLAAADENGLGPYANAFLVAVGAFFSTFVYNLFFMNLPVQGEPIEIAEYFRARVRRHWKGILGGIIGYAALITNLIAARVEGGAKVGNPVAYGLAYGAPVVAALCGVFIWNEFAGADATVKTRLALVLILLAAGIVMASLAIASPPY